MSVFVHSSSVSSFVGFSAAPPDMGCGVGSGGVTGASSGFCGLWNFLGGLSATNVDPSPMRTSVRFSLCLHQYSQTTISRGSHHISLVVIERISSQLETFASG